MRIATEGALLGTLDACGFPPDLVIISDDAGDSGISNLEITETTALALGETVVDVGDNVVEGILGGLGAFATLRGMGHTAEKYNNGGDGTIAIEEGIEIAITGTLKGI